MTTHTSEWLFVSFIPVPVRTTMAKQIMRIGSPVGGPHSAGEIRGAAAVNVLSRVFAFAAHGGALGWEWR
jgi:hypothetical protein